jgi:hypothetical protein
MGLLFVDFNIFSFLLLKLDRGPYREARRPHAAPRVAHH